jgi:hypothetical protein
MQKKMHNYVLKKKKEKKEIVEHRTHANPAAKPHRTIPNAAGYA